MAGSAKSRATRTATKEPLHSKNNMENKKIINANIIKLIAIFAMTVDHIAWVFIPDGAAVLPALMHFFGRITAPVMCFFIAEGYYHTRNVKKYIFRLFVFSLLSHFPYLYAFGYSLMAVRMSMMWTLMWGLIALAAIKSDIHPVPKACAVAAAFVMTVYSDWYFVGVSMVLIFGLLHGSFKKQAAALTTLVAAFAVYYAFTTGDYLYAAVQTGMLLSLPVLYLYNGQRGKLKLKWLFYAYYPLHLTILAIIKYGLPL